MRKIKHFIFSSGSILIFVLSGCSPKTNTSTKFLPSIIKETSIDGETLSLDAYSYDEDYLGYTIDSRVYEDNKEINHNKKIYRFSSDYKSYSIITYDYENGSLYSIEKYEYIASKTKSYTIIKSTCPSLNEKDFIIYNKKEYIYNNKNLLTDFLEYTLNDSDELILRYETIYDYFIDNSIKNEFYYSYSSELDKLILESRDIYKYDKNTVDQKTYYRYGDSPDLIYDTHFVTTITYENNNKKEHLKVFDIAGNNEILQNEFITIYNSKNEEIAFNSIIRNEGEITSNEQYLYERNQNGKVTSYKKYEGVTNPEIVNDLLISYNADNLETSCENFDHLNNMKYRSLIFYNLTKQILNTKLQQYDSINETYKDLYFVDVTYTETKNDNLFETMEYSNDLLRWVNFHIEL